MMTDLKESISIIDETSGRRFTITKSGDRVVMDVEGKEPIGLKAEDFFSIVNRAKQLWQDESEQKGENTQSGPNKRVLHG
jgi:hypothetical protein